MSKAEILFHRIVAAWIVLGSLALGGYALYGMGLRDGSVDAANSLTRSMENALQNQLQQNFNQSPNEDMPLAPQSREPGTL